MGGDDGLTKFGDVFGRSTAYRCRRFRIGATDPEFVHANHAARPRSPTIVDGHHGGADVAIIDARTDLAAARTRVPPADGQRAGHRGGGRRRPGGLRGGGRRLALRRRDAARRRRGRAAGTAATGDHTPAQRDGRHIEVRRPRTAPGQLHGVARRQRPRPDAHRVQVVEFPCAARWSGVQPHPADARGVGLRLQRSRPHGRCSRATAARQAGNRTRIDGRHRPRCGLHGGTPPQPEWISASRR